MSMENPNTPPVGPVPVAFSIGHTFIERPGGESERVVVATFHTPIGPATYFMSADGAKQLANLLTESATGIDVVKLNGNELRQFLGGDHD